MSTRPALSRLPRLALAAAASVLLSGAASAQVFINEIFVNPPGGGDDREYIEILGTPGRSLDGYAIAVVNGTLAKYYPLGSIPPLPAVVPEVDEFFSLDGLSLGPNGMLVIGRSTSAFYSTLLPDSAFQIWTTLWDGPLDTPGNIQNDGSNTVLLLRNRRGATQADPADPAGNIWVKDSNIDVDFFTGVVDPQDLIVKDQYGDGSLDQGGVSGLGVNQLDTRGSTTLADASDDLEVVDEIAWEHERGWEYALDDRHVDVGGTTLPAKERRVRSLDDPAGINPDILTRVDYRTQGAGWTPGAGTTGEQGNGNNWQDTATEQWIRGESATGLTGAGTSPFYYYSVVPNLDPEAPQPFETHVPSWLADGSGVDFDFVTSNTYQILAGRLNPLATAFIPGDVDRDGDADAADITKLAAVFGDADWVFSNSFGAAAEGDDGDPATQTRPWDVDGTGRDGIEASDLQWVLNFQGDTTGKVVGRTYDSTTPSATGVTLGAADGTTVAVTSAGTAPGGNPLGALEAGDLIEFIVSAQVTSGANTTAGQQNGVMQYVHDALISAPGVLEVYGIEPLGLFGTTREDLAAPQGSFGDLGLRTVNGYTTSFTQGLVAAAQLYRIKAQAVGQGSATLSVLPAAATGFAASTPSGVKLGHLASNGNPASASYVGASTALTVVDGVCQTNLGFAGPGQARFSVCGGDLSTGNPADILLVDGPPSSFVGLLAGISFAPTALKGGVLVPLPALITLILPTDPAGSLFLPASTGAGFGPFSAYAQFAWKADPAIPYPSWGFSNALRLDYLP